MDGIDSSTQYILEKFKPLNKMYFGQVVDNADPKVLGRVKVEIPGLTQGIDKEYLPWYSVLQPAGLGGSSYTTQYAVPQVNTTVAVEFPTEDIYAGIVTGVLITRVTTADDKMNLSVDYIHPTSSENHFTTNWDKSSSSTPNQKHYSPDMTEDYPFSHGWVSNAMTWFKENMMKRTLEFVHNSYTKLKIFGTGDTIVHVTGNMKLVVEKDLYVEVRGNSDLVFFNNVYEHIIGQSVRMIEKTEMTEAKRGMILKGLYIQEN